MHIRRLQIQGLRSLDDVRIDPDAGINLLIGPNGAGKSSVLEAVYLLSHGRSFRSGARDALVQRGCDRMSVYAEVVDASSSVHRLGLGRQGHRWKVQLNGESSHTLGELVAHCAVICFEPGSHALIAGPGEERRRFLDWGVFHVEQEFLQYWRRYQRALRQRNALLRHAGSSFDPVALDSWESELSQSGERIALARATYVEQLRPHLERQMQVLLPELGSVRFDYRRGWSEELSLDATLKQRRERDAYRGHTAVGPHRADWSVVFEHAPAREHLSRGQEKLCAMACVLAQGHHYAECHGNWPIVCLDDLASELDVQHQSSVVRSLSQVDAQVLVTGTEVVPAMRDVHTGVFHVEQGRIGT